MAEYLIKEDVINALRSVPPGNWNSERYVSEIESIPAADVKPVRQGKWIRISEYEEIGRKKKELWHKLICSECKETATEGSCFFDNDTPFCPWCGAQMEEDTEDG